MGQDGTAPSYRADIDGLRAIAVTSVVLFHAGVSPFRSGYVGVDIFFVISGYLIGGIILRETIAKQFSFARFYARRARRILPALFTVVLASCAAGWFLLSTSQFRDLGATATSALLGTSNISYYRFRDYFAADSRLSPLLMTWSLGVEEQFYLLFPILMLGMKRWSFRRRTIVLATITLASLLASLWATYAQPAAAFYLLPFRAWELGVGVIAASVGLASGPQPQAAWLGRPHASRQALEICGLALIAVSIFAFDESTPFPGFAAVLPVVGTAALLRAEGSWVNRTLLSFRPLVFVGTISYSWYLWHWPLLSYVRNVAFDEPPSTVLIATAATAFGLAVLSWRFVEQPFRHGPIRVRPVLAGYAAALAATIAVPIAIKLGNGFPDHVSPATAKIEAARAPGSTGACLVGWDDNKPNLSSACVSERNGHPTVALVGDSHASALGDGLRELAAKRGFGYEILAKPMCRPLAGVTNWHQSRPRQAETCAAFMASAFTRALSNPSVETVILAGAWPSSDPAIHVNFEGFVATDPSLGPTNTPDLFRHGLERAVALFVAAGKHVIVVGDVPRWRLDVSQVALTRSSPARSVLAPWLWSRAPCHFPDQPGLDLVYQPSERDIQFFRSLARETSVTYVDMFGRFCAAGTCAFERDGNLLYIDTGHLSVFGSRYAMQDLPLP